MTHPLHRKPFALANWKMAMTMGETLEFAHTFSQKIGALCEQVTTVLCPPYTALQALSHALSATCVRIGAQNLFTNSGVSHTGEISAPLLTDVGCRWVMLGHWEVRRRDGDTDRTINNKIHAACRAGLRPILMIGETAEDRERSEKALAPRLSESFDHCSADQVSRMVVCYEPEWTIGAREPAPPDAVAETCSFIRNWIRRAYGSETADAIRLVYGGGVTPDFVGCLLASPDVDGLGAGRAGRDPLAFAGIVEAIARLKTDQIM